LSRLLNVSSDGDDVTVAGKLFHATAWRSQRSDGFEFGDNQNNWHLNEQ